MARGGPLHPKPPGRGLGERDRPAEPPQLGAAIREGEHSPPRRGKPSLSARSPQPVLTPTRGGMALLGPETLTSPEHP